MPDMVLLWSWYEAPALAAWGTNRWCWSWWWLFESVQVTLRHLKIGQHTQLSCFIAKCHLLQLCAHADLDGAGWQRWASRGNATKHFVLGSSKWQVQKESGLHSVWTKSLEWKSLCAGATSLISKMCLLLLSLYILNEHYRFCKTMEEWCGWLGSRSQ